MVLAILLIAHAQTILAIFMPRGALTRYRIFQTAKIKGGRLNGWGRSDGTLRYIYTNGSEHTAELVASR